MSGPFDFLDPGPLVDGDLELVLSKRFEADPEMGLVPAYVFHMRRPGDPTKLGRIALRIGSTRHLTHHAGQLGYTVEPEARGHRFAARAIRLVLPLAARHGLDPIWITCRPENAASVRTLEIAGAEYVGTEEIPEDCEMREKDYESVRRYRLSPPLGDPH